jgi:predicted dehydrogenase
MGAADIAKFPDDRIVAIADVDWGLPKVQEVFAKFPEAKKYKDFRKMLREMDDEIDAVVISIPDHMHFLAAYMAIYMGKHVYVQKPATQTIAEARLLLDLARETGVCTQMGNQGHSNEGTRLAVEWAQGGVLGQVKEIHVWTNRPWWPQGMPAWPTAEDAPAALDWDLYLGRSEKHTFSKAIHPFKWRGYRAFGTGSLGDMGCHMFDAPFWALDLVGPTSIDAEVEELTEVGYPKRGVVTYQFPARGNRGPVKFVWYEGGKKPELPPDLQAEGRTLGERGQLWIGDKAMLLDENDYCNSPRIVPEAKMKELRPMLPPKTIPRVPKADHYKNWVDAIRAGKPELAGANFEYSIPLTELVLLGALAQLSGKKISWDHERMSAGDPAIDRYVHPDYRRGWAIEDMI